MADDQEQDIFGDKAASQQEETEDKLFGEDNTTEISLDDDKKEESLPASTPVIDAPSQDTEKSGNDDDAANTSTPPVDPTPPADPTPDIFGNDDSPSEKQNEKTEVHF